MLISSAKGDAQVWMDMIHSRNRTVYTYDAKILAEEFRKVVYRYTPAFKLFDQKMAQFLDETPEANPCRYQNAVN